MEVYMKKILIFAMCLCLLSALAACSDPTGNGGADSDSGSESQTVDTTSSNGQSESESVEISEDHAPDFTVLNWEGEDVKLSDLFGKPIVLNFWASGCGPCRNEMPDFQAAYEKYGNDVQFMMVNYIGFFGETVDSAKEFVNGQEYTFPVYFDTDNSAAATYGIYSIPQTFFINKHGEIVAYAQGMIDESSLEEGIGMIFNSND